MRSLVQDLVDSVHERYVDERSGEILRGIPALEDVDPDSFGLCLATADGHVYETGDTRLEFCIQSISKPFTYGLALSDLGMDAVDAKIDVEPSGELYNQISLDPGTHRPRNPMINAGALVAASLVAGETQDEQAGRILATLSAYAGRELAYDPEIYVSQLESGHRNRAIGHMLREVEIIEGDPNVAHEVYLRACSTMITCHDLALMGAAWANGGVVPKTGERVLSTEHTERVLSVMATCGMYDAAGAWVADVGMAAKSGVGGGVVAVLPGQVAIAAFSPRLDDHGNSVRAHRACRHLSNDLELHAMHAARSARSAIRDSYDIVEAPSSIQRPQADRLVLEEHGRKARIYEAHGDLLFAGAESVVREICAAGEGLELLALDVRRVNEVSEVTRRLLGKLRAWLASRGCEAFLIDPDGVIARRFGPSGEQGAGEQGAGEQGAEGAESGQGDRETEDGQGERPDASGGGAPVFRTIAATTVHFEEVLLERYGDRERDGEREYVFTEHPALDGVPEEVVSELRGRLEERSYADGELLVAEGDEKTGVLLVTSGRVRTSLRAVNGEVRRLATLRRGTCFGDVHVVTGNPHAISVHAEGPVEALELRRAELARIADEDPAMHAAVLGIFMYEIREDVERALRSLATSRVAPMTAS